MSGYGGTGSVGRLIVDLVSSRPRNTADLARRANEHAARTTTEIETCSSDELVREIMLAAHLDLARDLLRYGGDLLTAENRSRLMVLVTCNA